MHPMEFAKHTKLVKYTVGVLEFGNGNAATI